MRPSWDVTCLRVARVIAGRSTCARKQVGCVLSRNGRILATGHGGSIAGQPHCIDEGCDIDPKTGGCIRTVHAELNALIACARHGIDTEGAVAYVTLSPCPSCFKALVQAGVRRIVYAEEYRIPPDRSQAEACGVTLEEMPDGV